jgi:hypothetical protein
MKHQRTLRQQERASTRNTGDPRPRTWTPDQLAAAQKLQEIYARKRAERDYPAEVVRQLGLDK